ncbi:MAG: hypothetical protein U9P42_07775 [Candidatus Fermentibacteria bacterium]|nr:hypothetical protein [Candidatus Fermentibacteria bacterium]
MKNSIVLITAFLLVSLANVSSAQIVVGTFDSRCVAAAYYRSADFLDKIDEMKAEHTAAEEAGDTELAAALAAQGEEQQRLTHLRVFSAGDIEEIIWLIWSELPAVAEEAGVDVIVSIWDIVYRDDDIRFVDVTDRLVVFFDPSDETLELIDEIKGAPAIPAPLISGSDH